MQLTLSIKNAIINHFDSLRMILERIESEAGMQYEKRGDYLVLNQELSSSAFIRLLGILHYEKFPSDLPSINRKNLENIKAIIHKMERFIADIFSSEILPKRSKFIEKWLD